MVCLLKVRSPGPFSDLFNMIRLLTKCTPLLRKRPIAGCPTAMAASFHLLPFHSTTLHPSPSPSPFLPTCLFKAPKPILHPSAQQYRHFAIRRKYVKRGSNQQKDEHITNRQIPSRIGGLGTEVRLVFPDASNKLMTIADALIRGQEENLDVVLVQSSAKPPTCKILDLGFHKYNMRKKAAEKRKTAPLPVKTIKFKVKIEKGDFQRKVDEARKFLYKGHTVRLSIVLVARFPQGEERATFLYKNFIAAIDDLILEKTQRELSSFGAVRQDELQPRSLHVNAGDIQAFNDKEGLVEKRGD